MKASLQQVGSEDQPGLEFEAPEPPLQPGDMLEFTRVTQTKGGHVFRPGDWMQLVRRTEEAPYGVRCSLGNWIVRTKYTTSPDQVSIWSSVDIGFSEGILQLKKNVRTRYDLILEDEP